MRIRTNDNVVVISGASKGVRSKVVRVLREENKVVVEGVNRVYRHVRRSQKNPQGGRLSMEMPVPVSKVQLICPTCNKGVRISLRATKDGGKERYCRKCSSSLGAIGKAS